MSNALNPFDPTPIRVIDDLLLKAYTSVGEAWQDTGANIKTLKNTIRGIGLPSMLYEIISDPAMFIVYGGGVQLGQALGFLDYLAYSTVISNEGGSLKDNWQRSAGRREKYTRSMSTAFGMLASSYWLNDFSSVIFDGNADKMQDAASYMCTAFWLIGWSALQYLENSKFDPPKGKTVKDWISQKASSLKSLRLQYAENYSLADDL